MKRILEKLGQYQGNCTIAYCDNDSKIKLSNNTIMHVCNKHIDVRFCFLSDLTKEGVVKLIHCDTQKQIVYVVTKPFKLDVFLKLSEMMGVCKVLDVNKLLLAISLRKGVKNLGSFNQD